MIDVISPDALYMVQFFYRVAGPPELMGLERLSSYRFRKVFIGSDVCDSL